MGELTHADSVRSPSTQIKNALIPSSSCAGVASVVWRWFLVDEGVHAPAPLGMGEARGDRLAREVVGAGDAELRLLLEGALAGRSRGGRLLGDLPGKLQGFAFQLIRRHDAVDETPFQRLVCVY